MKITLISTTATNIGDDLIRRGIVRLIEAALPARDVLWEVVNKHQPWTVYRSGPRSRRMLERLPAARRPVTGLLSLSSRMVDAETVFTGSDLVIQCGTPVMWFGVHRSEWQHPIYVDALARRGRPPMLNLSGGSCFPWNAPRPIELTPADRSALHTMLSRSDVFTARDRLAAQIAEDLGQPARVFCCAAMHAGGGQPAPGHDGALILNVMPRGGHFDWNQNNDPVRWLRTVDTVVAARAGHEPILFLCHDDDEFALARSRWPEHEACLPRTTEEYLSVARRGRIGLVNRMHAAVTLGGLGIPAVAVGTDTRLLMVEQTGQPIRYLGDTDPDDLIEALATLDRGWAAQRNALLATEQAAFDGHRAHLLESDVLARAAGLTRL